MAKNLNNVRPPADKKWEQDLILHKFDHADAKSFRLIGDVFVFGRHWVSTQPHDQAHGKKFPRECTNFNPESELSDLDNGCPACKAEPTAPPKSIGTSRHYLINAIDRDAQADGKRNPVVGLGPLPAQVLNDIIKLKKNNKPRGATAEGHHVTHPEHGCDILIRYDRNATPKWNVSLDPNGRIPLTEEEEKYRLQDFDAVFPDFSDKGTRSEYNEESLRSLTRCGYFDDSDAAETDSDDDDSAATARALSSSRAPAAKKAAAKPAADDSEEEEEPAPEPVKAATTKRKPAPAPVDEESDETEVAAAASKPAPKLNIVKEAAPAAASSGVKVCPHPDDEHEFGRFNADETCFKCKLRQSCISASNE